MKTNRLISLFVEELENGETVFATWCKGCIVGEFFYGKKVSNSDLMKNGEMIKVKVSDCDEEFSDLFIKSKNPKNDSRITFSKESECPCTVSF